MDQLRFSIPEILSLIGVAQCVYLLVYMLLRSGRLSRAGLPLIYFFVLALAFLYDFAEGAIGRNWNYYYYFQWAAWFLGPPLSVPMIMQIAQITKAPSVRYYWAILLVPLAFAVSAWIVAASGSPACAGLLPCEDMKKWLTLTGFLAGCISLLAIWSNRDALSLITERKTGKDRYWLILALIVVNIAFLLTMLISLGATEQGDIRLARTVFGLGFVYLVGTSLFRIYPQSVLLSPDRNEKLSPEELEIARKVEKLLNQDKVYHESAYARTDLAHECQTSEAVISKVINFHFKKSFPQIINEYRVEDAKQLLGQTEASIKTVSEEVGFNSLASFNRVFREIAGETPSDYRKKIRK